MNIRPATNSDTEGIRDVVFGVLAEYDLLASHEGVDADLTDLGGNYMARGGLFEVMVDGSGRIIGSVGLFPRGQGVAELRKMYLRKEHRGRGLGKKMLDRVISRARELGFRRIELETSSKLVEAIALYRKYGFESLQPDEMICRCDQAFALDLK